MKRYTLYCSLEQTKKALELGAPIERGHEGSKYFNIGVPTLESFDDRWYTLLNLNIQPSFVHELQHALRLCGLNNIADNLKV